MKKYKLLQEIEILQDLIFYGIATKSDIKRLSKLNRKLEHIEYQENYNGF